MSDLNDDLRARLDAAIAEWADTGKPDAYDVLNDLIDLLDELEDLRGTVERLSVPLGTPVATFLDRRLADVMRERDECHEANDELAGENGALWQKVATLQAERAEALAAIGRVREVLAIVHTEGVDSMIAAMVADALDEGLGGGGDGDE